MGDITGSVNQLCLQSRSVCDFEQRIDVVKVDLPESEYLNVLRVESRKVCV